MVDSEIDKIRIVRGELPLEVQDLEDEIEGLETRTENIKNDTDAVKAQIKEKEIAIKDHQTLMKKYEAQQLNVRNNREYESLSKEIEYQSLEIQLCEKRINEYKTSYELKKEILENATEKIKERKEDLKVKKQELEEIVSETEKEEQKLVEKSEEYQKKIEDTRLMSAYHRIRKNARNGLAVVLVERDACGGCFNKIPPQRQLDIKMHKKIIVCEYCGRILIDRSIEEQARKQN
jgi:predicted  nucleic acid-binding Zn-ribbon protein